MGEMGSWEALVDYGGLCRVGQRSATHRVSRRALVDCAPLAHPTGLPSKGLQLRDCRAPPDSPEDLADRPAEVDFQALLAGDFQATGVEAELMEDRGVDVGHVVTMLGGVE